MTTSHRASADRLSGKVALVTGASRGIGRGVAQALAGEGARVVVASRSRSGLDQIVDEIVDAGGSAVAFPCDIGHRDQVVGVVNDAANVWGRLDILVNNAQGFGTADQPAASPVLHPLEELNEDEWDYTYRTGPTATMWAMKAAFSYLSQDGGKIINFASGQGLRGSEGSASYNCAKEAIRALSRTAAREWGKHGISVNVICPLIQTDATDAYFAQSPGLEAGLLADLPLRRMGKPKDVGELAVFLASSGADFITGMTVMIDSGKNMTA
jgi:NAD(P)-dependent dehydrogenase (short-subunit alcohol dehydrogenase family)